MKRLSTALLTGALALIPVPALAQTAPAPELTAELDTATVAEARKLMDVILPPETREAMFKSMLNALTTNIMQGMRSAPGFDSDMSPQMRSALDRFIARQTEFATNDLTENLPGMLDAIARAYARRFTIAQLREIGAFFSTPTGKYYALNASSIMSDPDVAGWQVAMMRRHAERMPGEMEKFKAEMAELASKGKKKGKSGD